MFRKRRTNLEQCIIVAWRSTSGERHKRAIAVSQKFNEAFTVAEYDRYVTPALVIRTIDKRFDTDSPRNGRIDAATVKKVVLEYYYKHKMTPEEIYTHTQHIRVEGNNNGQLRLTEITRILKQHWMDNKKSTAKE